MTSYEFERALVYLAEQIIKTFGKDVGVQEPKLAMPAEPLIEDEKIRKAVRAWAEVDATTLAKKIDNKTLKGINDGASISFEDEVFESLLFGRSYTIEELCGEEEDGD